MFKPLNTSDHTTSYKKVLLYAMHGWGKTTQAKHYKARYGDGFIISGESGLSSIRAAGIDYLPFSSWDGEVNPAKGIFSFKSIIKLIQSDDFKSKGYKWIMIDSLTELSDHAYEYAQSKAEADAAASKKALNGFAVWEEYGAAMIGACKWVRDLPMHVIVTALAKQGDDDNGNPDNWPMVRGKQVQQQLPGIFDCVLCGVKRHDGSEDGTSPKLVHYVVTDEYRGWHGKVRDEKRRLKTVEREDDITNLFERMDMPDSDYETYLSKQLAQQGGK